MVTENLAIWMERPPKISVASKGEEEAATHELLPWSVFPLALITLDSRLTIFGLVAILTHCQEQ